MSPADVLSEELGALGALERIESDLRQNVLPFWRRHAVDPARRTFYGSITNDLRVDDASEQGSLLTARILWTFSAAYSEFGCDEDRRMADLAYADLNRRYQDRRDGGYYWSTGADGSVTQDRKQIYGQAFAIYALSEYHAATGDSTALQEAIAAFRLLETHARDRVLGGYFEAFARDWSPISEVRLSPVDQNDPKSQNTLLHVMEAYTRLYSLWPEPELGQALRDLIETMLVRVVDPQTFHLGLFFAADWSRTSENISYGHDIEFSWLLCRAADVLRDPDLFNSVSSVALRIAEVTLEEGLGPEGGIRNLGNRKGIVDATCEWWPQAEAVVGFFNAYQLSGDRRFLMATSRVWKFVERYLIDHVHGEWFRGVDARGRILSGEPKVSFWKCPYHNGRMGLEIVARLKALPRLRTERTAETKTATRP